MGIIKKYPEITALAALAVIYIAGIFFVPGYYIDDFYIYAKIEGSGSLVSANPQDFCYLHYRPVYFSFASLEYILIGNNPVLLKFVSLLLLLASFYAAARIIKSSSEFFNAGRDRFLVTASLIAAGLHTSVFFDVLWLSAKNEILMLMFFFLSVLSVLKYLMNRNKLYLLFYVVFFTASLLSKQQSVILPLLMLGIYYMWRERFRGYPKILIFAVWFSFAVSLLYTAYVFYNLSPEHSYFIENIWKKPFVAAASVLYVFSPMLGDLLYPFFVQNKTAALIVLLLIAVIIYFMMRKQGSRKRNILILKLSVLYVIAILPVLFLSFSERLITIPIAFFILLAPFVSFKNKAASYIVYIGVAAIIIMNSAYTYNFSAKMSGYFDLNRKLMNGLQQIKENSGRDILIVSDIDLDTPYKTGYFAGNRFYYDSSLTQIPVFYQPVFDYRQFNIVNNDKKVFSAVLKEDILEIESESEDYCVSINYTLLEDVFSDYLLLKGIENHSMKFYKKVIFQLKDESLLQGKKLVFFNGIEWEIIR